MKKMMLFTMLVIGLFLTTSCKNTSGDKAEVSEAAKVVNTGGTDYAVNTGISKIHWEGSKPTGTHMGTVDISAGNILVNNGKVTGGNFTLDMSSINVMDLEGEWKTKLETHLKGTGEEGVDDFFNTNQYPTATFDITKITGLEGDPKANSMVYGNLTLKGQTKQIGFKASIAMNNNTVMVTSPEFTIDRTEWGIKYGSPTFFEGLQDKAIANEIGLKIDLKASASAM